ncbi:MAG TPA: ester cyclase [Gemmatimonadales bacterium]|nr:ester cyclase [Gemmatimonadales bacterium]
MAPHANETLIRRLYSFFNNRKYDEAQKLVSDEFEWRDAATGETYRGRDGVRQFMERWVSGFDDARIEIERIVAGDHAVATEFIGRGTHTGTIQTPAGELPPTNRKIELRCCEVGVIENGKIRSGSTYYDAATLMAQLGVTDLAGAAH